MSENRRVISDDGRTVVEMVPDARWNGGERPKTIKREPVWSKLANVIREIGDEPASQSADETRLEKAIRALYKRSGAGDSAAARVLFERGWGHVPQVTVNATEQIGAILAELGLTIEDVANDPLAVELFTLSGVHVPSPAGSGQERVAGADSSAVGEGSAEADSGVETPAAGAGQVAA